MNKTSWSLLTPPSQGAIAIIQLEGEVDDALFSLTGERNWPLGHMRLKEVQKIDEAICVKIKDKIAQIMPHGGLQIIRDFSELFKKLNIQQIDEPIFPEAKTKLQSKMLHALSKTQSPIACELLLKQQITHNDLMPTPEDLERSLILDQLIYPPAVVILGDANTGKSTLMNAMTAQETSIVFDQPGVTRDAVGARVICDGLAINLYDLPGIRKTTDAIERNAIKAAKSMMEQAVLVVQVRDAEHEWISSNCQKKIKIGTKLDLHEISDADLCVSAITGQHITKLAQKIREALIPDNLLNSGLPWFFDGYRPTEE